LVRSLLKPGSGVGFTGNWDVLVKRDLDFSSDLGGALKDPARGLIQILLLLLKPHSIRSRESLLESESADGHRDHYDA
jgi:hypothetical protein